MSTVSKKYNGIIIRQAVQNDLDKICVIENESFSVPWSREAFKQCLESIYRTYVATYADEVVGYVVLMMAEPEAEVLNIAVSKENRKHGIGEKLMDYSIDICKDRSIWDIFLEVRESNTAARQLYQKKGFVDLDIRRDYYSEPKEDAMIMKLHV